MSSSDYLTKEKYRVNISKIYQYLDYYNGKRKAYPLHKTKKEKENIHKNRMVILSTDLIEI